MENEKSKILIFGGTGYIGNHLARASCLLGHPTYVYARPLTPQTTPSKLELHKELHSMGTTFVLGELEEHEKIVSALREVDIVISALAYPQVLDQLKIIDAIKVAGNIKRFLPSEYGSEEDRITPLPPFEAFLDKKRKIRRVVEAAGIPYTFVSANCCASYFVNYLLHPHEKGDDNIVVYGSGEAKAVLNYEEDIATYTIKVANDPRTCNRVVIYRPPKNILSQLELISLWEKKTGRSFNKVYISEEEIVKLSETLPPPKDIPVSILHSVFIKGQTVFELREDDMEASRLYPDHEYTTIDQLLDIFLVNPPMPATAAFG
ncbi:isoeugenol synthase 1-like [Alnus glutinosa]|uniref:isoeugenol synthase 1-like n=1 Tax=Alnus glutinosa TaxID=3517 RepID=UPI002D7924EE|nr:isoeugenol synthase 1-like [Alnus glutinosa]